jgi:hypothetical protein
VHMEKEDPCLGPGAATFYIIPAPRNAASESQERGTRDGVCRCALLLLLLFQQGACSSFLKLALSPRGALLHSWADALVCLSTFLYLYFLQEPKA